MNKRNYLNAIPVIAIIITIVFFSVSGSNATESEVVYGADNRVAIGQSQIKMFKNHLYVIDANKVNQLENVRGVNGTFFQKNIPNINILKKFITKKCQTVSYFGFNKEQLKLFLLNNNLSGIDRMVPIGNALDINIVWDGFEVTKHLSRVISLE